MMSLDELTAAELRRLLSYNPDTGIFRWRVQMSNRAPTGSIAGSVATNGYRYISINRRKYTAHRLAWLYVRGEWPRAHVDHRHGARDDNRFEELREATVSQNLANRGAQRNNKCGSKGVHWNSEREKWVAQIHHFGQTTALGRFDTKHEAETAYAKAADKLFGEFARVK